MGFFAVFVDMLLHSCSVAQAKNAGDHKLSFSFFR